MERANDPIRPRKRPKSHVSDTRVPTIRTYQERQYLYPNNTTKATEFDWPVWPNAGGIFKRKEEHGVGLSSPAVVTVAFRGLETSLFAR